MYFAAIMALRLDNQPTNLLRAHPPSNRLYLIFLCYEFKTFWTSFLRFLGHLLTFYDISELPYGFRSYQSFHQSNRHVFAIHTSQIGLRTLHVVTISQTLLYVLDLLLRFPRFGANCKL